MSNCFYDNIGMYRNNGMINHQIYRYNSDPARTRTVYQYGNTASTSGPMTYCNYANGNQGVMPFRNIAPGERVVVIR